MATIRWCPIYPKWDSYQPLRSTRVILSRTCVLPCFFSFLSSIESPELCTSDHQLAWPSPGHPVPGSQDPVAKLQHLAEASGTMTLPKPHLGSWCLWLIAEPWLSASALEPDLCVHFQYTHDQLPNGVQMITKQKQMPYGSILCSSLQIG